MNLFTLFRSRQKLHIPTFCALNHTFCPTEAYPNQRAVVSGNADPPIEFPLPADERRLLFHYPSIPAKFGLCVTPTSSIGGDVVTASAVPGWLIN